MTVHQCPKCELKFSYKTEVDDHCWHDHPEFRHEYPAAHHEPEPLHHAPPPPATTTERHAHIGAEALGQWLQPTRPRTHHAASDREQTPRQQ